MCIRDSCDSETDALSDADSELDTDCDSDTDALSEADSELDTDCDSDTDALEDADSELDLSLIHISRNCTPLARKKYCLPSIVFSPIAIRPVLSK